MQMVGLFGAETTIIELLLKCPYHLNQTNDPRLVMIGQCENECISLSVLPVARVMIAQWENEWISLSILPVARDMIAQWENECISLSILPVARVMIAQWENECISLSSPWPGFNSRPWWSISTDFSLADHTLPTRLEPVLQKMAQSPLNGTTQPVENRGGRPQSNHGQTMAEIKRTGFSCNLCVIKNVPLTLFSLQWKNDPRTLRLPWTFLRKKTYRLI